MGRSFGVFMGNDDRDKLVRLRSRLAREGMVDAVPVAQAVRHAVAFAIREPVDAAALKMAASLDAYAEAMRIKLSEVDRKNIGKLRKRIRGESDGHTLRYAILVASRRKVKS